MPSEAYLLLRMYKVPKTVGAHNPTATALNTTTRMPELPPSDEPLPPAPAISSVVVVLLVEEAVEVDDAELTPDEGEEGDVVLLLSVVCCDTESLRVVELPLKLTVLV